MKEIIANGLKNNLTSCTTYKNTGVGDDLTFFFSRVADIALHRNQSSVDELNYYRTKLQLSIAVNSNAIQAKKNDSYRAKSTWVMGF